MPWRNVARSAIIDTMFDMRTPPEEMAEAIVTVLGARCARPEELSERELVDRIALLENAKCRLEAAQAEAAAALDRRTRERHRAAGVPERRVGEGVGAQIALARRVSPSKGARLLALAKVLTTEMPATLALMRAGRLSEWRATILTRETTCLSTEDRRRVDHELCNTGRAAELGDRELEAAARRIAYEVDAESVLARAAKAASDRTVTIRPAPDLMTIVTALLPMTEGVATYAALRAAAESARAAGDGRSRGQVMADTLVERTTGRSVASPASIDLRLVMTDRALLTSDDTPALVPGYGPVPAEWARRVVSSADVALKRLFTSPATGDLIAMESRSRIAPAGLREFIAIRDGGLCRTPYCGSPIRHVDHIVRAADGGATAADNLQGLCERCNHAKEAPGWRARPGPDATVISTTPTGHLHASHPPSRWPSTRPLVNLVLNADYVLTA